MQKRHDVARTEVDYLAMALGSERPGAEPPPLPRNAGGASGPARGSSWNWTPSILKEQAMAELTSGPHWC